MGWNADTISAIAAILSTPLVGWLGLWVYRRVRMRLARRAREEKLIATMERIVDVFFPKDGAPLNNVISDIRQTQQNQASLFTTFGKRLAGVVSRQRDIYGDETVPLFEADETGGTIYANQSYLDLVERPLDQIMGRGWEVCLFVEDRAIAVHEWEAAVDAKRVYEATFRLRSRSGRLYRVQVVVKPLVCEAREVTGFIGRYVKVDPIAA